MYKQVLDAINVGIVIIDSKYSVVEWNRWMEIQSNIKKEELLGSIIFNHYPHLSSPSFLRSCKSVLNFGNYVFYSQKLHNYLFPFPATGFHTKSFDYMQQSCTLTPIREENGEIEHIVITIQDVTESVYLERSLKMMTQQDSLTGIHNRRYLDKRLEEEMTHYRRKNRVFSLLMIDIDNFKLVNDNYGHQFGDIILKNIADISSSVIRGSDILARYGGEEFCVILPDTNKKGAYSFAERLRILVEEQKTLYEKKESVTVTISIGIAETTKSIETHEELLDQADTALYASKADGKNKVTVFSPMIRKNQAE